MILIVEDNDDNIRLMEYLLRARGHELALARDGAEGVAVAAESRPALVLMDIQMPGMDGYEALAALRRLPDLSDTRVIAVTAFAMVGDRDRVKAAGFDGYIAKPITPESFADQVEGLLRGGPVGASG